jgi:hypothetical protein
MFSSHNPRHSRWHRNPGFQWSFFSTPGTVKLVRHSLWRGRIRGCFWIPATSACGKRPSLFRIAELKTENRRRETALCALLAWAGLLLPLPAAELAWERTEIVTTATLADKRVEATYAFTNTSGNPVEIVKTAGSCSCLTSEISKKIIAPGGSGTLKAVFLAGGRRGPQEESIVVRFADNTSQLLRWRVELPDTVALSPDHLAWKVGAGETPQSFEVTLADPAVTRFKSAQVPGRGFEAEWKELEAGRKYRVTVRPVSSQRPVKGAVRLELADPQPRMVYFRVAVES